MSPELLTVLLILGAAIALFVTDRLRLDLIALLVLLALALSGVLTLPEALAGFADPLVVMIAGLFVVSGALVNTGLAAAVGNWLARIAGPGEGRLLAALMLAAAALSAFMSTTGTVAIMLPIAVRLAWRSRLSPSRLLLPVSFAALLGGTLTVIATPPNLVASQALAAGGHGALGFFAMAPVGLAMLAVALAFMLTLGRRLLPARAPSEPEAGDVGPEHLSEVAARFGLSGPLARFVVPSGSKLQGETLGELRWPERFGVQVIAIDTDPAAVRHGLRSRRHLGSSKRIGPFTMLDAADRVLAQGSQDGLRALAAAHGLQAEAVDPSSEDVVPANLVFAELLVPPRSSWIGKSLAELAFRERYRLVALGIQRGGDRISHGFAHERLRFGDVVLARGRPPALELIRSEREDAVVLSEAAAGELPAPAAAKAPVAGLVVVAMLLAMALTPLPLAATVLVAVVALVITGCITAEGAYRSISWQTIVLIAGMLPLATALQSSGGVEMASAALSGWLGEAAPRLVLAGVFLLTVLVTQFLTNTTSALLIAPIAYQTASALAVSPVALLVAVALGASCTFLNPVASPATALVLGPGHYRFSDVPRLGLPLLVLMTLVVLLLLPVVFPL